MKAFIVTGFRKMRDDVLCTRAYNIIEKMKDNPHFPMPSPSLEDVTTALTEYRHALEQAQLGGKDKTAIKKTKRLALEELLYHLAGHIKIHGEEDLAILLSTGFGIRKPWTRRSRVLVPPANFLLENGPYPGSFKASVSKTPGVRSYVFEYTSMPLTEETQWTQVAIGARVYMFTGLTSGQQYAFRVTGVGYTPKPVYSDVVSRFAL